LVLVEGGSVHAEILAQTEMLHADLLVIGTHGRSGFEHLVLGSVTEKLLRKTGVPILTVPRRMPDAVPTGSTPYRQILCAVDFSECSLAALSFARSLAAESEASLTVVNVVELPPTISDPLGPGPFAYEDLQRELEVDAANRFEEIVPDATRASSRIDAMITVGKPYQEILRIAREREAELIVVGVHGRSAVDRVLFGSTAHHLVRQSVCPVLTLCSRSAAARVG
jgi:nucleotide-binding universal stress UspA family protein